MTRCLIFSEEQKIKLYETIYSSSPAPEINPSNHRRAARRCGRKMVEVDDDHAEALDFELARHPLPSLTLQLEGAGHFGHTEPHAIWLGVKDNAGLMALHQHEGAGHFGHMEPHAIWLGVKDNAGLVALHQHCKHAARRAGITLHAVNSQD